MNNLTGILGSLKKEELSLLEAYCQNLADRGYEIRLRLLELFKEGKVETDQQACKILYSATYSPAFSRIKEKMIYDVCRIILLQNPESLSPIPWLKAGLECRTLYSVGEVFLARNAREEGITLLNKALAISRRYDLIPEMISILQILSSEEGFNKGWEKFNDLQREVDQYLEELQEVITARRHYFSVLLPNIFNHHQEMDKYNSRIGAMISEVENMNHFGKSTFLMFFYYNLKVFKSELDQDYIALKSNAENLLKFTQSSHALDCKPHLGAANLQLANAHIMLRNYKEAIRYGNLGLKNFERGNFNELQLLEIIYLAAMLEGDLKEAERALKKALKNPNAKIDRNEEGYSFTFEKWQVYEAFYFYKNQEYQRVRRRITKIRRLLRDSIYWYFSVRLLEVYTDIATEGQPGDTIAAIEKQMQRKQQTSNRLKLIVNILSMLDKNNLNFNQTATDMQSSLKKLYDHEGQHAFNPWAGEVIPFEEWFYGNCEGVIE